MWTKVEVACTSGAFAPTRGLLRLDVSAESANWRSNPAAAVCADFSMEAVASSTDSGRDPPSSGDMIGGHLSDTPVSAAIEFVTSANTREFTICIWRDHCEGELMPALGALMTRPVPAGDTIRRSSCG